MFASAVPWNESGGTTREKVGAETLSLSTSAVDECATCGTPAIPKAYCATDEMEDAPPPTTAPTESSMRSSAASSASSSEKPTGRKIGVTFRPCSSRMAAIAVETPCAAAGLVVPEAEWKPSRSSGSGASCVCLRRCDSLSRRGCEIAARNAVVVQPTTPVPPANVSAICICAHINMHIQPGGVRLSGAQAKRFKNYRTHLAGGLWPAQTHRT